MSNKQEMLYGMCMIALALQLTSVSTDSWSVKKENLPLGIKGDLSLGLWKACGSIWKKMSNTSIDADICVHLPPEGSRTFPKNSLHAVRVFAVAGIVLIFLGLMCMMYMKNYKRCPLAMLMLGGLCSIIANVIWATELLKFKPDESDPVVKFDPGYSFYLNLAGGLVGLMSAAYYYYA